MNNKPIQLSPNSLNLFLECRRCFWLEKKQGIKRPPPYPYALNMAVDAYVALLRKNIVPAHNQDCKFCQWFRRAANF